MSEQTLIAERERVSMVKAKRDDDTRVALVLTVAGVGFVSWHQ
jgi:hypothetical protein